MYRGEKNSEWTLKYFMAVERCELHDRVEKDGGIRRYWNAAAGREIDREKRKEQRVG